MEEIIIVFAGIFCLIWLFAIPLTNLIYLRIIHKKYKKLEAKIEQIVNPIGKATKEEKKQVELSNIKTSTIITEETIQLEKKLTYNFERQFSTRLLVWIAGVALSLSGFFFIKYSIENNLLSPMVRIILGGISGWLLLIGANFIRKKPSFANGTRISQSLSGAGIAILYVSSFAATNIYHFIPNIIGFLCMSAITGTAIVLSLRHGPLIALLGLIGGLLTPFLINSGDHSGPILFIYLYFVFSSLMLVIKHKNWWVLSLPTLIFTLIVVLLLITRDLLPENTAWAGLFLMAISVTIFINSRHVYSETPRYGIISILNYIGLCSPIFLMALLISEVDFALLEWSLFGLMAFGSIILAYFDNKLYGFVPWVSMAVSLSILYLWETHDYNTLTLVLLVFATIYAWFSYFLMWKQHLPLLWSGLTSAASISFYLLAYFKLQHMDLIHGVPFFWGFIALGIASIAIYTIQEVRTSYHDHPHQEYLLAIFAITAAAFTSIGLTIELKREFLSVALAMEMLAVAWVNSKIPMRILRFICMALALSFALLLLPQILLLIQLAVYSLIEAKLHLQETIPIVQWPIFQLGIPSTMFIGTSYFLRMEEDSKLVRSLELASIALVAVMGYYLTRHAFHIEQDILFVKANFFERGVVTNILFVYSLMCFFIGRKFYRIAFSWSAIVLSLVATFRITYFDLILYNPLWAKGNIGSSVNLLYGLPIIWLWLSSKQLLYLNKKVIAQCILILDLTLLFELTNINVRYLFHGENLHHGITTSIEMYSYSIAWLILGISLLLIGTIKKDQMIRYASLVIMIITVGKVFLYDASALEGLYRVSSFLGLGLSLLGISWFYMRFVFHNEKEQ